MDPNTQDPGIDVQRDTTQTAVWENRIVGYEMVDPARLLANPHNFRAHPRPQIEALTGSLNDLGYIAPVIVNRLSGHIVDGHLRAELARARSAPLPVAYVELSEQEEREALVALDPIAAMATTDRDKLDALLSQVTSEEQAIRALLEHLAKENDLLRPRGEDPGADLDRADELQAKWQVKPGQTYQVGPHLIMCEDATDEDAVTSFLDGVLAHICVTDPPWNVGYGKSANPRWRTRAIANDDLGPDFASFIADSCEVIYRSLTPGGLLYLVMSAQEWPTIDRSLREAGFHWSSTIIWAKDRPVLSRKDYLTQYEPIWYGWKRGAPRSARVEDRSQSDLWQVPRPARSEEHPTMKPAELVVRALRNSSRPGDVVFDPFLGSGTTAVAAEQTGRVCYAIELEPKYVAVSLERLCGMGLTPQLVKEGE